MTLPYSTALTAPPAGHVCVLSPSKSILLLGKQFKSKYLSDGRCQHYLSCMDTCHANQEALALSCVRRTRGNPLHFYLGRVGISFPLLGPGLPCESNVFLTFSFLSSIHRKPWPGSRSVSHCLCGMRMYSAFSE